LERLGILKYLNTNIILLLFHKPRLATLRKPKRKILDDTEILHNPSIENGPKRVMAIDKVDLSSQVITVKVIISGPDHVIQTEEYFS